MFTGQKAHGTRGTLSVQLKKIPTVKINSEETEVRFPTPLKTEVPLPELGW